MAKNTPTNIVKYKKKVHLNIGIVLFGIILFYLIATVIMYVATDRTTSYEVRMGSILNDISYTGMAIREESIVTSKQGGYVNYYTNTSIKSKVGTKIGVISPHEIIEKNEKDIEKESASKELTSDQQNTLGVLVQSFTDGFSDESFSDVYSFKDSVQNSISNISAASKASNLDQVVSSGNGTVAFQAEDDGIVVYNMDGYEKLKVQDVKPDMFTKTEYKVKEFYNNMKVSAGDPLYKLITSEDWTLVVPISKNTANELREKTSVRVRFKKDNQTLIAGLKIEKKDKQNIAYLSFSSSMIRYADERFLDIEIIIEDETGLKIPKSAVVEKEFFVVPEEYLTRGGNSNDRGVLRKTQKGTEFLPLSVYYTDAGLAYLPIEDLAQGDTILKPDSNMIYTLKEKADLQGVYNINKGYAVFEQIKVLCESEEYYIVEAGNSYSLANYDHIALNAEKVKENDIISQ